MYGSQRYFFCWLNQMDLFSNYVLFFESNTKFVSRFAFIDLRCGGYSQMQVCLHQLPMGTFYITRQKGRTKEKKMERTVYIRYSDMTQGAVLMRRQKDRAAMWKALLHNNWLRNYRKKCMIFCLSIAGQRAKLYAKLKLGLHCTR